MSSFTPAAPFFVGLKVSLLGLNFPFVTPVCREIFPTGPRHFIWANRTNHTTQTAEQECTYTHPL